MRILVLGGTQFVGRHIVEALLEAGHSVTTFTRGQSPNPLPVQVERLHGDRDQGMPGLESLSHRTWDTCVDVSGYTARQVRMSTKKLRSQVGHYVYISAVSVYGDPSTGPVHETYSRVEPAGEDIIEVVGDMYGRLKVTCEDIVQEMFAEHCALLRPQIVAGPHDPFDRFSYWVRRASQGGETLAPGDGSDSLQFVDANDVARFVLTICDQKLQGAFNLAGDRHQWSDFLAILGTRNIVWIPAEIIKAAGLTEFDLPLFRATGAPRSNLMYISNERARRAGLTLTSLEHTTEKVRQWLPQSELSPALSAERETEVIRKFRAATLLKG